MSGEVVRGVAGRRESYRVIQSLIAADARPKTVAEAYVREFGFKLAYVADLDAIAGHAPNWACYREIASAGLQLLIDAGVADVERASAMLDFAHAQPGVDGIVVGLESVSDAANLADLCRRIGRQRAVFSLDLLAGRPLTQSGQWHDETPLGIATAASAAGFYRLIVLDLATVGAGQGPSTIELARELVRSLPEIKLIGGGGVRDLTDVQRFFDAGFHSVLVASALHDLAISPAEVRRLNRLPTRKGDGGKTVRHNDC